MPCSRSPPPQSPVVSKIPLSLPSIADNPMIATNAMSASAAARADAFATPAPRAVAWWLLACCALVFCMVVVGGATRLTHSGLSIVEWQPIVGTLPPLTHAQWLETFAKYQLTPEYQQVNRGMTLGEFQGIFWWEYFHRLLGRLIGFLFLLPLLWFGARRQIDRRLALRLAAIFVLGGLQGAMGWYMVQSGLVDDPRVSQYRLTAHLLIAFLIFASMLWVALDLLYPRSARGMSRALDPRGMASSPPLARLDPGIDSHISCASVGSLRGFATALVALVFLMVLSGGFVAGIHAGHAYNTFPLMNGNVVP